MQTMRFTRFGRHGLLTAVSGVLLLASGSAFAQAPPNDDCPGTVIPSTAPDPIFTDTTDTTTATLDPADPLISCNTGDDGNNTVWYQYTPDASGFVNFSTVGSTSVAGGPMDTVLGLYTGSCGAPVEVACIDSGFDDELKTEVTAGTPYLLKIGEFAGGQGGGTLELSVEPTEPPTMPGQFVLESVRDGISPPMSELFGAVGATAADGNAPDIKLLEIPNLSLVGDLGKPQASSGESPGSLVAGEKGAYRGSPKVLQSFEGGENDDNAFVLGILLAPPDTIGDVGNDHYVQMYNLLTEIFDKEGNTVLGPFPTNGFFTGLGGQCEFTNSGDPIVLYDEETERWFVSQFAISFQFGLCIAVSTTSDPTGSYYQYEFDFSDIGFPDYPKYGFATGAINVMANMFEPFLGTGIGVIDKAEAMEPGPASMVFWILENFEWGFIPGDNDGPVFDNTKPTFFTNNGFNNAGGIGAAIDVWEIEPDFENLGNSTVAEVASIPVTPFDIDLCDASREACIPQPGSGTGGEVDPRQNIAFLAAISDRLMHRGQTRDDGIRKTAILSHTVDADGTGKAGVRWYELRNHKDRGWELKKENTFSPDGDHRWMGSIAMTASGETCLGYSVSSETRYPSIGVAGRKGTSNHMNVREAIVFDGNVAGNVQRQTVRWGDYSSMSIDPVNDTCWYTQEYAKPNSFIGERFGWGTRVINFQLPGKK